MSYEIPKEIKAKPKLMGLEVKELLVLLLTMFLIFTVFKSMVHKMFLIPYFIVSIGASIYLIAPSTHNPERKNYHSLILLFRKDNHVYHPVEIHKEANEELFSLIKEENNNIVPSVNPLIDEVEEDVPIDSEMETVQNDVDVAVINEDDPLVEDETFTDVIVNEQKDEEQHIVAETVEDLGSNLLEGDVVEEAENNQDVVLQEEKDLTNITDMVKGMNDKEDADSVSEPPVIPSRTLEDRKKSRKKLSWKNVAIVLSIALFLGSGSIVGSFLYAENKFSFFDKEPEVAVNDEEVLMKAIRSASLQKYDEAVVYFDEIDYELLEDDDKDVMLLSYLFTDQAETSIKLEPKFDETVVSYYKAKDDFKFLRELNEKVKSDVIEFEIAVVDRDYEKVIALGSKVKVKEERSPLIVEAYLNRDNIDGAIGFASQIERQDLLDEIQIYKDQEEDKLRQEKEEKKKKEEKEEQEKEEKKKKKEKEGKKESSDNDKRGKQKKKG